MWACKPRSKLGNSMLQTLILSHAPSTLVDILCYLAPPLSAVLVRSSGKLGGNVIPVFEPGPEH